MPAASTVKKNSEASGDLFKRLMRKEKAKPVWITVYGPRKLGKTTTTFTLSQAFQDLGMTLDERRAQVDAGDFQRIHIDDVAYVVIDKDATGCAVDIGATVEYEADYALLLNEGMPAQEAIVTVIKALNDNLPESVHTIVLDTISTLDKDMMPDSQNRAPADDTRAGYGFQLAAHQGIVSTLRAECTRDLVFLCHAKHVSDIDGSKKGGADAKKRRRSVWKRTPEVVPSITGQGADGYLNNSSAIFALLARTIDKRMQPRLVSGGFGGFESGTRFESIVNEMTDGRPEDGIQPDLGKIIAAYRARQTKE